MNNNDDLIRACKTVPITLERCIRTFETGDAIICTFPFGLPRFAVKLNDKRFALFLVRAFDAKKTLVTIHADGDAQRKGLKQFDSVYCHKVGEDMEGITLAQHWMDVDMMSSKPQ